MEQGNNTSNEDYLKEYREYRIGTLKIFGGIQIGLGILCGILSLAGIVIDGIHKSAGCTYTYHDGYNYPYSYWYCPVYVQNADALLGFDITCFILSGWCLLNGSFPFFMNKHRQRNWRCMKIAYMVLCIVGASVIVPTVFSLSVVGSILRGLYEGGVVAVPGLLAVISFVEVVIAIVAASVCCCCSSFGGSRNTAYVYVGTSQTPAGTVLAMPTTQIQGPFIQTVQTQNVPFGHDTGRIMTQQTHTYPVQTIQQTGSTQSSIAEPPPYKS